MGKKQRDKCKEKDKEKGSKKKGMSDRSSRELPTIAEEDISVVDNQILGYLQDLKQQIQNREETLASVLRENTAEVRSLASVVDKQGRVIVSLTEKVRRLESQGRDSGKKIAECDDVVDVDCLPTRSLREILRDVAAETGMPKTGYFQSAFKKYQPNEAVDGSSGHQPRPVQWRLEFVTFSNDDMNILYSIKQRQPGTPFAFWSHNRTEMVAEETPCALILLFRPPTGMRFVGTKLAVAAYIFATARDERERLVDDSHCDGTRLRLWSLIPGRELYDDVLNMVVGMCTARKFDNSKWWLPTTFSQMIVSPELYNQATMDYIKDRYMGHADGLKTMYVPMHIGRHWYLLIIDIWGRQLVYLDSMKSEDVQDTEARIGQMMEVARFVESMLKDKSFWLADEYFPPFVSDYEPLVPEVGHQADRSMDCGVWVCQWMVNSHLWLDYNLPEINSSTRMSLAVDLVTSPHNPLANAIWEKAVNFWDAEMLRDFRARAQGDAPNRSPGHSGSETI
ncbi:hypothetical protein PIB30_052248 [Stylosanthes scabra]|uniref:Ubiquitin-like protease family profile domain-containing protein n=1 Tax=Stylosanthes scabra TaxID=79078 RepID=A0ABU6UGZ7_9FABA|nr:hypothetical protein [Stylosanthes scabra]